MSKIQNQVKLPVRVALEVVLQGISIRIGRSVVTMLGVALGIAFLMSILTGQEVKKGVSDEEAVRRDVDRMYNFFIAEIGPPKGRRLGLVVTSPLNEEELRMLARLQADGLDQIQVSGQPLVDSKGQPLRLKTRTVADPAAAAAEAHAILIVGDGALPSVNWTTLLANAGVHVLAVTRGIQLERIGSLGDATTKGPKPVLLQRVMQQDEIDRLVRDAKRDRFRSIWIIAISLAVTVICITNSMLMSVTERFREIGTMKCLGALSSFIRRLFLIESSLTGLAGSVIGSLIGGAFSVLAYSVTFGFSLVFSSLSVGPLILSFIICVLAGIVLSVLAALYPANIASRMVPANALRSNI